MAVTTLRHCLFKSVFVILSTLAVTAGSQATETVDEYAQRLIETAAAENLWQRPEWLKLLHYKPSLLPNRYTSQVDAPRFFLAENGKRNPKSELDATLAAFFQPFPADRDEQHLHPQCIFVARYQWLKQQLKFDNNHLPEHTCWRFDEWMEALNPKGVTLIFPTAYINSPASMFGHTLIRIDTQNQNEQNRLLSYAINFGADTGNDGGLAYAVKGLMGGYPGGFSVQPYYLKVREYNDMENRDIWEYQLNLSETETRTLLLHAWELRGIWFDYFFFSENCSYHLLSLIETARPELQLTDQFKTWAIPSDTVRAIDDAGLVDEIVFRPSRHATLTHRMAGLEREEIKAIQHLAAAQITPQDETITSMPKAQQARMVELAHEFADYHQDENEAHLHNLLQARSALSVTSPRIDVPGGARPDQGHDTARSSLIIGREDGDYYQELQLRPAYHDLLDPAEGYASSAQIIFFGLDLRHSNKNDSVRVQHFTPVDIISLTPVSDISTPISWQFDFGLTRKHGQQHNRMISTINSGAGLSWSLLKNSTVYTLLNLGIDASKQELRKGYAAGFGGSLGLLTEINANWAIHLFGHSIDYTAGEAHNEKQLGLEQRISLGQSDTLRMQWTRQRQLGDEFSNFNLSWQHFF